MAHECPDCGQACYCDGDDTWIDLWATDGDCDHECGDDEWPDDCEPDHAEALPASVPASPPSSVDAPGGRAQEPKPRKVECPRCLHDFVLDGPPCGGSRCFKSETTGEWIHSSKSYDTCEVLARGGAQGSDGKERT